MAEYRLKDPNSDWVEVTESEVTRVRLEALGYSHEEDDKGKRTTPRPTAGAERSTSTVTSNATNAGDA